jgi:hypothetical protein
MIGRPPQAPIPGRPDHFAPSLAFRAAFCHCGPSPGPCELRSPRHCQLLPHRDAELVCRGHAALLTSCHPERLSFAIFSVYCRSCRASASCHAEPLRPVMPSRHLLSFRAEGEESPLQPSAEIPRVARDDNGRASRLTRDCGPSLLPSRDPHLSVCAAPPPVTPSRTTPCHCEPHRPGHSARHGPCNSEPHRPPVIPSRTAPLSFRAEGEESPVRSMLRSLARATRRLGMTKRGRRAASG